MKRWHTMFGAAVLAVALSAAAQPYGMGPGMMGGGPGYPGAGPGMMGGWGGGWGMGPGMMGGWGMGPGMMDGGYADWVLDRLDLSADQRGKIADIQKELGGKQWELMRRTHDQHWQLRRNAPGTFDEQAARAAYAVMVETHRQMFELSLDARKRIDAVLTPQQREQLARPRGRP